MDAQSLAHVFVALCIVMGNVVQWNKSRSPRHERGHDLGRVAGGAAHAVVFSFLYKDNPLYKFAEHLFVALSGYYIVLNSDV